MLLSGDYASLLSFSSRQNAKKSTSSIATSSSSLLPVNTLNLGTLTTTGTTSSFSSRDIDMDELRDSKSLSLYSQASHAAPSSIEYRDTGLGLAAVTTIVPAALGLIGTTHLAIDTSGGGDGDTTTTAATVLLDSDNACTPSSDMDNNVRHLSEPPVVKRGEGKTLRDLLYKSSRDAASPTKLLSGRKIAVKTTMNSRKKEIWLELRVEEYLSMGEVVVEILAAHKQWLLTKTKKGMNSSAALLYDQPHRYAIKKKFDSKSDKKSRGSRGMRWNARDGLNDLTDSDMGRAWRGDVRRGLEPVQLDFDDTASQDDACEDNGADFYSSSDELDVDGDSEHHNNNNFNNDASASGGSRFGNRFGDEQASSYDDEDEDEDDLEYKYDDSIDSYLETFMSRYPNSYFLPEEYKLEVFQLELVEAKDKGHRASKGPSDKSDKDLPVPGCNCIDCNEYRYNLWIPQEKRASLVKIQIKNGDDINDYFVDMSTSPPEITRSDDKSKSTPFTPDPVPRTRRASSATSTASNFSYESISKSGVDEKEGGGICWRLKDLIPLLPSDADVRSDKIDLKLRVCSFELVFQLGPAITKENAVGLSNPHEYQRMRLNHHLKDLGMDMRLFDLLAYAGPKGLVLLLRRKLFDAPNGES